MLQQRTVIVRNQKIRVLILQSLLHVLLIQLSWQHFLQRTLQQRIHAVLLLLPTTKIMELLLDHRADSFFKRRYEDRIVELNQVDAFLFSFGYLMDNDIVLILVVLVEFSIVINDVSEG